MSLRSSVSTLFEVMKKILLVIALPVLLFANTAFGVEVKGVWGVDMNCVRVGEEPVLYGNGVYVPETAYLVIIRQEGDLFNGLSCSLAAVPGSNFYGAIMGKKIYFTSWDSISVGAINSKGTIISNVVSQNPLENPPTAPGICIGSGVLLDVPLGQFDPDDPCAAVPVP